MIASPNIGFLIAGLLILLGLVFYYPFVYRKIELKFVRKFFFRLRFVILSFNEISVEGQINLSLQIFFQLQKAQVQL